MVVVGFEPTSQSLMGFAKASYKVLNAPELQLQGIKLCKQLSTTQRT